MGTFPSPNHRGQQLQLLLFRKRHDLVHHLVHGLPADLPPAAGAVRYPDSGIEKPEIIVDLCHRPHSGSGVPVRGFLIDGNGRGKPFDTLHIRFFHLSEELPCIGGQRFHVSSLSLGVYGIKGQRGFPGPAEACQHHKLIPGNIDTQVFQIVLVCSPDPDKVFLLCILCHVFNLPQPPQAAASFILCNSSP